MKNERARLVALTSSMFLISFALILLELLLTRIFAIVLFAQFAHLALAVGMLGISIGAILQHLWPQLCPDEGLERRIGWLAVLMGVLALVAVVCVLEFPIIEPGSGAEGYGRRSQLKTQLLDAGWFAALLPILTLPFISAGLAFSGAFQRRRAHIGQLYGADLVGGAVGAIAFIPLLSLLAGPDVVWLVLAATAVAAAVLWDAAGFVTGRNAAALATAVLLGLGVVGGTGTDLLRVHHAAGFSEQHIVYSEWTPLARMSLHIREGRAIMVLDNTSRSEILQTTEHRESIAKTDISRSLVYLLHEPPARVAILAASAGPEVSVAAHWGYEDVDAIDIAGEVMDIVATRFADAEVNPYRPATVRRIKSDGRAAILHADRPYDIIQMVHANLWSYGGLIADAWSPSLLETEEAFDTYLDRLTPDGTLSFGRGEATENIARSAAAALRGRGVSKPHQHLFYARARANVLLVKKRPFTQEERDKLVALLETFPGKKNTVLIDPTNQTKRARRLLAGPVMTDDRPYLDDREKLMGQITTSQRKMETQGESPLWMLYRSMALQAVFVLAAGLLFVGVPLLRLGPNDLRGLRRVPAGLLYVACLGYGYLAIETVLVHALVLFVGHPTYAVTAVILSMLLFSGLGSIQADRIRTDPLRTLQVVLVAVLMLAFVQAFLVPHLLHTWALGLPLAARVGIVIVGLAPLGLVMGMPFPLAMRLLPDEAGGLVPWAWALNGWTSVVGSLITVLTSRLYGYQWAFALAIVAYALALALASVLPTIRR